MKTMREVKGALQAALDENANGREAMVEAIALLERLQSAEPPRLTVPLYKLEKGQFMGLHQNMLTIGDDGEVSTSAGLGGDAIWLRWKDDLHYVRGAELLRAFVRQIDPDAADLFPHAVKEVVP